jgi:hypothetical protein
MERITVKADGFDPNRHLDAIIAKVSEAKGPGWEVESADPAAGTVTLTRQTVITEVHNGTGGKGREVRLSRGIKPADGPKTAARLEDANPGLYMTKFEPFLGKAVLSPLTDEEARCRGAVAVALGVQPWDVQVQGRPDGGFDLELPRNYQPSKAERLNEVATCVVGREGWYVTIDAQKLTASFVPSDPPTFPAVIPTPLERLGHGDVMSTPFGMMLPEPGEKNGREARIYWKSSSHALLAGMAGAGKSVIIQALVADRLSNGAGLAIVDDASKAVDFLPFKDRCAVRATGRGPGGRDLIPTWGCDSLGCAVAVLAMLCEEGERRAKVLGDKGLVNYLDMPERDRFQTIFVVADEFEALVAREPVPKSLSREHPMRVEAEQANIAHDMIAYYVNRIIKEMRFVGLSVLVATQVGNASTGLPPSIKSKMGHFILAGSNPSEPARRQTFTDERAVPRVPANVASGGQVAMGTGSAQIEGAGAFVYKSYFAKVEQYTAAFNRLGLPAYSSHEVTPSTALIDNYLPRLDDVDERDNRQSAGGDWGADRSPVSGRSLAEIGREMGDPNAGLGTDPETGERLRGFERANAMRSAAVRQTGGRSRAQDADDGSTAKGGPVSVRTRTPSENNPFRTDRHAD